MLFRNSFQDLSYALRQLSPQPRLCLHRRAHLALSVGVATAVFCVIDAVILRPLPYANPDKIVSVESRSHSGYTQAGLLAELCGRARADHGLRGPRRLRRLLQLYGRDACERPGAA